MSRAKALGLETIQALAERAPNALFAHAMTGGAVASLAIIAAPQLEVLLRCLFHARG
ncbi:hypothetical protein [Bradyrhizobium cenepequi]